MANWIKRREVTFDDQGNRKVTPGIVRCECGEAVTISCDGVACGKCGQPFNLFGQRLVRNYRDVERYGEAADYMNEGGDE